MQRADTFGNCTRTVRFTCWRPVWLQHPSLIWNWQRLLCPPKTVPTAPPVPNVAVPSPLSPLSVHVASDPSFVSVRPHALLRLLGSSACQPKDPDLLRTRGTCSRLSIAVLVQHKLHQDCVLTLVGVHVSHPAGRAELLLCLVPGAGVSV